MTARIFAFLLDRRWLPLLFVVALTGLMAPNAAKVKPDYAVEHFFPVWSDARQVYDRFKHDFPHEDTHALVIVKADDILDRSGLERLARLEKDLESLPHVIDVEGPLSVDDIVDDGGMISIEPLFPGADLEPDELAERVETATTDPLFIWRLAKPDATAVTIRLTLAPGPAGRDAGRQEYQRAAEKLIEKHAYEGQTIVLSGLPTVRAKFAGMIAEDANTLVPIALLAILLLLFVAFRSVGAVVAGLLTILAALVWSQGFMGLLGYQMTTLTSILPIVVMIISISDTVHIVNDFFANRRSGTERRPALVQAMKHSAGPCLATELVIAGGFLSLIAVNIVAVVEFGIAAAAAMLLTWLANMTVLPLVLSLVRHDGRASKSAPRDRAPWAVRMFGRAVDWIGRQTSHRPKIVVGVAVLIVAGAAVLGLRAEKLAYVFDDLRPESQFYQDLRAAEESHGGLVPVAIYYESVDSDVDNAVLEPEVIASMDRAAALLRSFEEINQASSVAGYLRKANRVLQGDDAPPDGLPETRKLAAQEVEMIDENGMLADYLSFDRKAAAALGYSVDAGSKRFEEMFQKIESFIAEEQAKLAAVEGLPAIKISSTGQLRLFRDVNDTLTEGLIGSFGGAILITLLMFFVTLRSLKLGLIGLIPNLTPMVLVVAFMAITGITLRPSTVVVFSIILVIADDDTVQYLARLRMSWAKVRLEKHDNYHRAAALETLRGTGLPMFVTSTSVSFGFLLLLASRLQGVADVGLLIGVTLFSAIFADLFLAPILVEKLKPKLGEPPAPAGDHDRAP